MRPTISSNNAHLLIERESAKAELKYYIESNDLRAMRHKEGGKEELYISTISKVDDTSHSESGFATTHMHLYKVSEEDENIP